MKKMKFKKKRFHSKKKCINRPCKMFLDLGKHQSLREDNIYVLIQLAQLYPVEIPTCWNSNSLIPHFIRSSKCKINKDLHMAH
jgi:hypothetical protein